jgi:hypothetical protein
MAPAMASPNEFATLMMATVLPPLRTMSAPTSRSMIASVGASLNAQRRLASWGSMMALDPASEIIGTPAGPIKSSTASELGVFEGPRMTSACSSLISFCAFFTAEVVSDPSSSTTYRIFSPPIDCGRRSIALRSGMPSEADGPVVDSSAPTTMSARATPHATNTRQAARPSRRIMNVSPKRRVPRGCRSV